MKIKGIDIQSKKWLKSTDLDNFFEVYVDKHNNYVYNLNSSIYFDIEDGALKEYVLNHDMHWPLISNLIYNTPRLAWLLMKLNNVTAADVFSIKHAGDVIKYADSEYVESIVSNLSES